MLRKPVMKNRVALETEQVVIAVLALAAKGAVRVILETRNAVGHFEPRLCSEHQTLKRGLILVLSSRVPPIIERIPG
jgi:hypothetical protein